jgi:hypothetical protein
VVVTIDGKSFTTYKFSDDQKYPYFWPVTGPLSGESVTTETSEPWPHHHSLFFGCDKVNGGNYWQDANSEGQILSQGPRIIKKKGKRIVFSDLCLWKRPGEEAIIRDTRRVEISAPSETVRFIDFAITLKALTDVRIERSNHSLFAARVRPELNVESGGTLVNAEGLKNHEGTQGKASPWCDYYGTWPDGKTEGIAIFQHPENKWYPSPWFTRDYGFFSPTPMNWLKEESFDMAKGETLKLQYRVVVHGGTNEDVDMVGLFNEYEEPVKVSME